MHQNDSTAHLHASASRLRGMPRTLCRLTYGLCCAAVLACALASGARAEEQPTAAMMEPVQGLVAFMSTLRRGEQPTVFARRGLCIIENFAPFIFCGQRAALNWAAGFRAHALEGNLSELKAVFGEAHDVGQSGNRAYFSLPTTWTGLTQGRRFEEHGAWSFVLERQDAGWRILGYGWGVTAYSETPAAGAKP